jgi:hypothetical protein
MTLAMKDLHPSDLTVLEVVHRFHNLGTDPSLSMLSRAMIEYRVTPSSTYAVRSSLQRLMTAGVLTVIKGNHRDISQVALSEEYVELLERSEIALEKQLEAIESKPNYTLKDLRAYGALSIKINAIHDHLATEAK